MLFRTKGLICLLLCEVLAAQWNLQAATTQSANPILKAAARLVVVDVVVTDANGNPVPGLRKEDFEVFENDKKQAVTVFEEHTGKTLTEIKQQPLPQDTFNNFPRADGPDALNVILLDSLNTQLTDQLVVHQQVLKYLQDLPREPTAVFALSGGLRMIHGFTSDPSAVLAALNDKGSHSSPNSSSLLRSNAETHAEDQSLAQMQDLAYQQPDIQAAIEALRQFQAEQMSAETDDRVKTTLSELQQLAKYLSGFPVRKNVVWFSQAFPLMTFDTGPNGWLKQYAEKVRKTADALSRARVVLYPVGAEGLDPDSPNGETIQTMSNAQEATSVQINQLQTASVERNANHATLEEFARDTGGKAFYNTNGLNEALAQAIRDGTRYYTLDYVPENQKMDGGFRKIRVKLNHGHYQLAYRRGYNADDEQTAPREVSGDPLKLLMAAGLPDFSQILYLMSVKPAASQPKPTASRAGDNPNVEGSFTRMDVDLAISENAFQWKMDAQGVRDGTLEVTLIAYDRYGAPMNWMVRSIKLSLNPQQYKAYRDVGIQFHFELDAPQSADSLRSGVYDPSSEKAGAIEVPLHSLSAATSREVKSN